MARINYADLDTVSDQLRALVSKRPPLNIYRMLAHGGPAAEGFLALGTALLQDNSLDTAVRELVILRVGILCRADYEVRQHKRIALKVGVSQEKVSALYDGHEAAIFTNQERTVLRYTDAVVLNVKAGDTDFRQLEALMSHQQMVELHLLIGFYMMVSRFLENFEVDLEDDEPPLVGY